MREYSLRRRLLVSLLLVFVVGVGATAVFYYAEMGLITSDLRQRTLQGQARELLAGLRFAEAGEIRFELPWSWADAYSLKGSSYYYTLYDASGRVAAVSPNLSQPLPFTRPAENDVLGGVRFLGVGAERLALIATRGPADHVLVVARGQAEEEALVMTFLEEDLEYLGVVIVPFVVAALILIWIISTWSLRPLVRASRQATIVGPKNLDARITAQGLPKEIQPLVDAVNGALDRLAGAYAAERRLTADAAHELRTPLAVLSVRLQRAKFESVIDWPVIEREIARMGRLVGQLLDLARKESAERMHPFDGASDGASVNLSRVVREAAAMVLPIAEEKARSVEVEATETVSVRGHADDLRDMVRNLLDNALIHGRGTVRVAVRRETAEKDRCVLIDVADQGSGIPTALREAVFERFRKGKAASPGTGLGLAIVRQVARSHGGEARILPGPGCRVRVSLPAADA